MPKVFFSEQALLDLERIFEFLEHIDMSLAETCGTEIMDATLVLQRHPLIGRPASNNLHELVISKGRSGYVALYRFLPANNQIDILTIRHQRESGFVD